MPVDFGPTAADYDRYRTGFPPELFARLAALGVGTPGQRVVDVGTGTGILARAFAAAGCAVTGVDIAPELLAKAAERPGVTYRRAAAEDTGLPGGAWDVVSAGQCWHWFDRPRAAAEALRLLVGGGALVLCYLDYRVVAGNVCAASEELVLAHHPDWPLAGVSWARAEWAAELTSAGFTDLTTIDFDIDVEFTHEQWRGRMRSCNGVAGSLPEDAVAAYDADLAALLRRRFPDQPLLVPHQVWAIVARSPVDGGAVLS